MNHTNEIWPLLFEYRVQIIQNRSRENQTKILYFIINYFYFILYLFLNKAK